MPTKSMYEKLLSTKNMLELQLGKQEHLVGDLFYPAQIDQEQPGRWQLSTTQHWTLQHGNATPFQSVDHLRDHQGNRNNLDKKRAPSPVLWRRDGRTTSKQSGEKMTAAFEY